MATASALVDKATSDLLIGPDWAMNLEICDIINYDPGQARDVVKAVKKRLSNKSAKVQLLALTVLETLMKNCGEIVHQHVAEKDILHEMVKIVKKKTDMAVRDKILVLLDSWQEAFGGPSGKYPQYYMAYEDLRQSGVEFPVVQNTVPIFTPPQTRPVVSHSHLAYGSPTEVPATLDAVMASTDAPLWSSRDMDGAQSGLEVLNEMLNALDPRDKQALKDDVIIQLVEQCRSNQRNVMQLVNTTSDEKLLFQGLALNDDLQRVLAKYEAIASGSQMRSEYSSSSPRGPAVYDQEEDEAEDEFSQLAHRSSSRPGRASANQDNRQPSAQLALPPPPQPIRKLSAPPSARGRSVDLLSGGSFEERSPKTPATPATASPTGGQVSSPLSEQQSAVNPFAGSPSFVATPSEQPQQQLHSITSNNGSILSPSSPYSYQQYQPSQYLQGLGQPSSSGHVALWASGNVQSPGFQQQSEQQAQTSHPAQSPQPEVQQFQPGYYKSSSFSDNTPQKVIPSIPPPPMLYTQRQRFFEEQTKQSNQTTNLEQQTKNLTLQDSNQKQNAPIGRLAQSTSFQARQASSTGKEVSSADRLFEDLVDLRSMSANFKTAGISSSLSRPNTSRAGGT